MTQKQIDLNKRILTYCGYGVDRDSDREPNGRWWLYGPDGNPCYDWFDDSIRLRLARLGAATFELAWQILQPVCNDTEALNICDDYLLHRGLRTELHSELEKKVLSFSYA